MLNRKLASDNPEKEYQHDYHGHPKYRLVYFAVLSLFAVTLLPNVFNIPAVQWIVISVFVLSVAKAFLVVVNFMHLRFEPSLIYGSLLISTLSLIVLFFLLYPDILTKDPYSKPSVYSYKKNQIIYYRNELEAEESKKLQVFDLNYIKKKLGYPLKPPQKEMKK